MAVYRVPVSITWPGSGSPGVNVFHLRTTEDSGTPLNPTLIEDGLDVLAPFLQTVYGAAGCAGLSWSVGAGVVNVETQEARDFTPRTGASGGTGMAPPALALVVGWRTTSATRRGRGRTFIGPLRGAISDGTSGTPEDAYIAQIQAAADTFCDANGALVGCAWAIWGQESAGIAGVNVARDITSARVRDSFAVLRSRRD